MIFHESWVEVWPIFVSLLYYTIVLKLWRGRTLSAAYTTTRVDVACFASGLNKWVTLFTLTGECMIAR